MSRSPEIRSALAELQREPEDASGRDGGDVNSASVDAAVSIILTVKKIKRELHKQ